MSWNEDRIQTDWLQGAAIAYDVDDVVAAFNRVERLLGTDWINQLAARGVTGASPTLGIVTAGLRLQAVENVANSAALVAKLRAGDASAWAELDAIWLLKRAEPQSRIELEPTVDVEGRGRVPDLRVARRSDPWTYVEVTRPDPSESQRELREIMQAVTEAVSQAEGEFGLEVFLRRGPTAEELDELLTTLPPLWAHGGHVVRELPNDLGLVLLNQHAPGEFVLGEHPGEADSPRLGEMRVVVENGQTVRHLAVRLAYSDDRADQFLRAEARQLPPGHPNLIMISTTNTVGGNKTWASLLERRLQPKIHTRVSGICLFFGGQVMTDRGLYLDIAVRVIESEHAQCELPSWIPVGLAESPQP